MTRHATAFVCSPVEQRVVSSTGLSRLVAGLLSGLQSTPRRTSVRLSGRLPVLARSVTTALQRRSFSTVRPSRSSATAVHSPQASSLASLLTVNPIHATASTDTSLPSTASANCNAETVEMVREWLYKPVLPELTQEQMADVNELNSMLDNIKEQSDVVNWNRLRYLVSKLPLAIDQTARTHLKTLAKIAPLEELGKYSLDARKSESGQHLAILIPVYLERLLDTADECTTTLPKNIKISIRKLCSGLYTTCSLICNAPVSGCGAADQIARMLSIRKLPEVAFNQQQQIEIFSTALTAMIANGAPLQSKRILISNLLDPQYSQTMNREQWVEMSLQMANQFANKPFWSYSTIQIIELILSQHYSSSSPITLTEEQVIQISAMLKTASIPKSGSSVSPSVSSSAPELMMKLYTDYEPTLTSLNRARVQLRWLKIFSQRKRMDEAKTLYGAIERSFLEGNATLQTFRQASLDILHGYDLAGRTTDKLQFYSHLVEISKEQPNVEIITAGHVGLMMKSSIRRGRFNHVLKLAEHAHSELGMAPTEYMVQFIIAAYVRMGNLESAMDILKQLEQSGIEMSQKVLYSMAESLVLSGRVEVAERMITRLYHSSDYKERQLDIEGKCGAVVIKGYINHFTSAANGQSNNNNNSSSNDTFDQLKESSRQSALRLLNEMRVTMPDTAPTWKLIGVAFDLLARQYGRLDDALLMMELSMTLGHIVSEGRREVLRDAFVYRNNISTKQAWREMKHTLVAIRRRRRKQITAEERRMIETALWELIENTVRTWSASKVLPSLYSDGESQLNQA